MGISSNSSVAIRTALGAAVVLVLGLSGCSPNGSDPSASAPALAPVAPTTSATTSAPKENTAATDYSRLLVLPGDISTPSQQFTLRSTVPNRRGGKGVSALFVNQDDTRAVGVTLSILPDPEAAKAALDASVQAIGNTITGGTPEPSPVGTDGTVISGMSPDGSKDMTVLLFTEGPAVARIEFGSTPGNPTAPEVVTDIGVKQAIALRTGLQNS
ncbi:hypothetical protein ACN27E_18610 [Mycobacterium sp. WMMD1722]|uniref:hypothetical protein n=1 Tax=Mycobacterium sp. WMMD1722 TaxID=3404117 RepID=UPI003BF48A9D